MITSPDNLPVGVYFDIITSNPINLRPLGGLTDGQRMKAWLKIRQEDDKINPARSDTQSLYEEHDFLVLRVYKLHLCYIVLQRRDSQACMDVLASFGITGDRERAVALCADMIKGTQGQIRDLQASFKDKPRITKRDCYRELSMIAKHYPVTAKSSLTEYRGAQANYIDYVNSLKHGNPDNF